MELSSVIQEVSEAAIRLESSADALFKLGKDKAEAERDYRSKLAQEILKLRTEGVPVSIVTDVAKGNVSEYLFKRDVTESSFKAGIEVADAIKVRISAYQTILKYQSDI
ncbi:hypothetical protein [Paenibacillus kribbensis]|uniref:hypothetical protein n=1 Tax=Paenibacillus kribbensis TaxID=172713 RepID=UPI000838BEB7|nr:hypothetical protein [Paenibacillus kribbensis]